MEEIKNEIEEEENQRWITILLIIGNLIVWTVIMLFISVAKVDALDLPQPTRMCVDGFINGQSNQTYCGNGREVILWNKKFWEGPTNNYQIGGYNQSDIYYSNNIQYDILGYCEGQSILISGEIAGLSNLFVDKVVNYTFEMNGHNLQCTFEQENMSLIKYTCSGIGGGNFIINVNVPSYSNNDAYEVAFSKSVNVACDNNISDLIVANQNNTQIITNAVENSTTNIINQMQDNLNLCTTIRNTIENATITDKAINSTGEEFTANGWHIQEFTINSTTTINVVNTYPAQTSTYSCFYNENNQPVQCINNRLLSGQLTIPNNAKYFRVSYTTIPMVEVRTCTDRTQAEIEELKVLQSLMHTTEWEDETPDDTWFNLYEESEDTLNEYQDVDLSNIDIDIDTDTSNWVWNTLTSLLNTNSYVFGMVITILSIGIGKLILGR